MTPRYLKILCFLILAGCGLSLQGSGTSPNDPTPSGTIVATGTLTTLNPPGKTVSGPVAVYSTGGLNYTLQIAGLTAPNESGLFVVLTESGTTVLSQSLRAVSGTQNYTFTIPNLGNVNWGTVSIYSAPNNLNYGQANLIPSTH
jgi:hypothetical protein